MKNLLDVRVVEEAKYILKYKATIRKTASVFNISKSTVHNDLSNRLQRVNKRLFDKVNKLLQFNLKVRYIRGGQATKQKFLKEKKSA